MSARWTEKDAGGTSLRDRTLAELRRQRGAASGADLAGIDLAGEDLSDMHLSGVDLRHANLSHAVLSGVDLSFADLSGANLFQARLDRAELLGANLGGSDCRECTGTGVGLGGADLSRAGFFGARLERSTLTKANLHAADFRGASLQHCRVREADLTEVDFTGADLQFADLTASDVYKAVLNNADLRETRLHDLKRYYSARWLNTDIRHTNFCGTYLLRRYIVDENYLHEFRNSDGLRYALYWAWWITSDCGRSLSRWAAWTAGIALLFAVVYSFMEIDYGGHPTWFSTVYFSIVTMTTLGYGDVVPSSTAAQVVATVEVILGYLALGGVLSIFANKMGRRAD